MIDKTIWRSFSGIFDRQNHLPLISDRQNFVKRGDFSGEKFVVFKKLPKKNMVDIDLDYY